MLRDGDSCRFTRNRFSVYYRDAAGRRRAQGGRPAMRDDSQGISKFDPPFEVYEPAGVEHPIVLNSPHSGAHYPAGFLAAARLDALTLRRSEDAFVDELFAPVDSPWRADAARAVPSRLPRPQPRTVRARPADVRRPAAGFRQYPLAAGRGGARGHSARGRRRAADLSRAHAGRGGVAAHRDAASALSRAARGA